MFINKILVLIALTTVTNGEEEVINNISNSSVIIQSTGEVHERERLVNVGCRTEIDQERRIADIRIRQLSSQVSQLTTDLEYYKTVNERLSSGQENKQKSEVETMDDSSPDVKSEFLTDMTVFEQKRGPPVIIPAVTLNIIWTELENAKRIKSYSQNMADYLGLVFHELDDTLPYIMEHYVKDKTELTVEKSGDFIKLNGEIVACPFHENITFLCNFDDKIKYLLSDNYHPFEDEILRRAASISVGMMNPKLTKKRAKRDVLDNLRNLNMIVKDPVQSKVEGKADLEDDKDDFTKIPASEVIEKSVERMLTKTDSRKLRGIRQMRGFYKELPFFENSIIKLCESCDINGAKHQAGFTSEYRTVFWMEYSSNGLCLCRLSCDKGKAMTKDLRCKPSSLSGILILNDMFILPKMTRIAKPGHDILEQLRITEYCTIGNVKISHCDDSESRIEQIRWVIDGNKVIPIRQLNTFWDHESKEIASYTCVNCNGCNPLQCSGDKIYKEHFGVFSDDCSCTFRSDAGRLYIVDQGERVQVDGWILTKESVTVRRQVVSRIVEEDFCEFCLFECSDGKLKSDFRETRPESLKISGLHETIFQELNSSRTTSTELTRQMVIDNQPLEVTVYSRKANKERKYVVNCDSFDYCVKMNCFFCAKAWTNFPCYSVLQNAIIYLLICVFTPIVVICSVLKIRKLIKEHKEIMFRRRSPKSGVYNELAVEEGYELSQEDGMDDAEFLKSLSNKKSSSSIPRPRPINKYSLLTILTLLFTGGLCCSDSTVFTVKSSECIEVTGTLNCKIKTTTELAVSPVGQDSCFNMIDETSKPIGVLRLKTKEIRLKCVKEQLYYTFEPDLTCDSHHVCRTVGSCYDDVCEKVTKGEHIDGFESGNSRVGISGCSRVSGCWANGCFICTDSCLFYRASLKSKNSKSYEVSRCQAWEWMIRVEVTKTDVSNSESRVLSLNPGMKVKAFGAEISLKSVSLPPLPELDTCYIQDGDRISMTTCNKRGELVSGKIGEIQCPTQQAAMNADSTCYFNENILKVKAQSDVASCSHEFTGVSNKMKENVLPSVVGNMIIERDHTNVIATLNKGGLFSMQIDTDFSIVAKRESISCVTKFLNLTGCFSCSSGASLCLETMSTSKEGFGSLVCQSSGIYSMMKVKPQPEHFCTIVHMDVPQVSSDCQFICSGSREDLLVKGHLEYIPPNNPLENGTIVSNESPLAGSINWSSLWSLSWFRVVFICVIICIGLPILLLILYCFVKFMWLVARLVHRKTK